MNMRRLFASFATVGLALLLGSPSAGAGPKFQLALFASPWKAKQFLETVQWDRYQGTRINTAQETAWEDTALFFDLKGDEFDVEFPNDRFYHPSRQHYGDLADPRPLKGDLKKAALELMERDKVHVYRFMTTGDEGGPDVAIILTPYTVKATLVEKTVKIRLDEEGLQAREGDEPEHDLGFLSRMGRAMRSHRGGGHQKGNKGEKKGDDGNGDTFYGREESTGYTFYGRDLSEFE